MFEWATDGPLHFMFLSFVSALFDVLYFYDQTILFAFIKFKSVVSPCYVIVPELV